MRWGAHNLGKDLVEVLRGVWGRGAMHPSPAGDVDDKIAILDQTLDIMLLASSVLLNAVEQLHLHGAKEAFHGWMEQLFSQPDWVADTMEDAAGRALHATLLVRVCCMVQYAFAWLTGHVGTGVSEPMEFTRSYLGHCLLRRTIENVLEALCSCIEQACLCCAVTGSSTRDAACMHTMGFADAHVMVSALVAVFENGPWHNDADQLVLFTDSHALHRAVATVIANGEQCVGGACEAADAALTLLWHVALAAHLRHVPLLHAHLLVEPVCAYVVRR